MTQEDTRLLPSMVRAMSCLKRWVATAFLLLIPLSPLATAATDVSKYRAERKPVFHALILSNSGYHNIDPIPSGLEDRRLMEGFFESAAYKIWPVDSPREFASRKQFDEHLDAMMKDVQLGDVVVVYYSGHGFSYSGHTFLVPLDYPKMPVQAQELRDHAISLNDVMARILKRKVSFLSVFVDACRTGVSFPLKSAGSVTLGSTSIPEAVLPSSDPATGFLPRYWISVPTRAGGQALGGSASDQPSVFTGILSEALPKSYAAAIQIEISSRAELRKLQNPALNAFLDPANIGGPATIELAPPAAAWTAFEKTWNDILVRPTRDIVMGFLTAYPGSQYYGSAVNYLVDNPGEIADSGGDTATNPELVERGFERVRGTDKRVGIIRSDFPIRYSRTYVSTAAQDGPNAGDDIGIVVADTAEGLIKIAQRQVDSRASKFAFDRELLAQVGEIATSTDIVGFEFPSRSSPVIAEFGESTPLVIAETKFDETSGDFYARLAPRLSEFHASAAAGQLPETASDEAWVRFIQQQNRQPLVTDLGLALLEETIDGDLSPGELDARVSEVVARARNGRHEINWVSIATGSTRTPPADPELYKKQLAEADNDNARTALSVAYAKSQDAYRQEKALIALRHHQVRQALIAQDISGKQITTLDGGLPEPGPKLRLRFFGTK